MNINIYSIFEMVAGSHLYGTNTETSDFDYLGVFMPSEDQVLGFERVDEIDLSIKSKHENGKNTKDAVDRKFYELRKFVKLALDNNPNVLEMLFATKEHLISVNQFGQMLFDNKHLFPYVGLKQKFLGYAFAQKHKMIIRTDNYHELVVAADYFNNKFLTDDDGKKLLIELLDMKLPFMHEKKDLILIGDLNFQKHVYVRKVRKMINERVSKATHRKTLLTKFGYDTKFASHLVRLMLEGVELLKTGNLVFPLKERQLILDIKQGKYEMHKILDLSDEFEKEIESLSKSTKLPKKQNHKQVQDLVKKMLKSYLFNL
jgi:predicted nucleotidyltransferase